MGSEEKDERQDALVLALRGIIVVLVVGLAAEADVLDLALLERDLVLVLGRLVVAALALDVARAGAGPVGVVVVVLLLAQLHLGEREVEPAGEAHKGRRQRQALGHETVERLEPGEQAGHGRQVSELLAQRDLEPDADAPDALGRRAALAALAAEGHALGEALEQRDRELGLEPADRVGDERRVRVRQAAIEQRRVGRVERLRQEARQRQRRRPARRRRRRRDRRERRRRLVGEQVAERRALGRLGRRLERRGRRRCDRRRLLVPRRLLRLRGTRWRRRSVVSSEQDQKGFGEGATHHAVLDLLGLLSGRARGGSGGRRRRRLGGSRDLGVLLGHRWGWGAGGKGRG